MHVGCWLSGRTGGLFVACPGFCPASFLDTSVRLGCPFVRHFFFLTFSDFWFSFCSHASVLGWLTFYLLSRTHHSLHCCFYLPQHCFLLSSRYNTWSCRWREFLSFRSIVCSHFWSSDHPVKLSSRPIKLLSRGHTSTLLVQITAIGTIGFWKYPRKLNPRVGTLYTYQLNSGYWKSLD